MYKIFLKLILNSYNGRSLGSDERIVLLQQIIILMVALLLSACGAQALKKNETVNITKKNAGSYNLQLGLSYLKQGDKPRAKLKLLKALKAAPDSPDVNSAMAFFLENTGYISEAKKYYRASIRLSGHGAAQLNNYGTFLCRQGQYREAEKYFLQAAADVRYVNSATAYENAGLCIARLPDFDRAKEYFQRSLQQDSAREQSLKALVQIEMRQKHYSSVLARLREHQSLVNTSPKLLQIGENAAYQLKQGKLAKRYHLLNNELTNPADKTGAKNEYNINNG